MTHKPRFARRSLGLKIADILDALAEPFLDQLVRVLANWSPSFEGAYLYYRGQQQRPPHRAPFSTWFAPSRRQANVPSNT
jgi:DNA-binding transcriptional LysR family regulator